MSATRLNPFDLVFGGIVAKRFPALRTSLLASGTDPGNRDAFILDRAVTALLRDLVPEDGPPEALGKHVALLHHAFLHWTAGRRLFQLPRPRALALFGASGTASPGPNAAVPTAYYIQLPERLVWAPVVEGEAHEPLDGAFVARRAAGGRDVLAIFGVHPDRVGFSVVEAAGAARADLTRPDGAPPFAPVLPGGAAAGLFSLTTPDELLALIERAEATIEMP